MASFNKVILLGNLTREPQLSYLPNSQTSIVDFGLATNRKWTGNDGQQREEVCFVDCKAFGRLAETIVKHCQKGRPLMIEGRLTFEQWQAEDGSKRSKHRVTVESFTFVDTKDPSNGNPVPGSEANHGPNRGAEPMSSPQSKIMPGTPDTDDIPF